MTSVTIVVDNFCQRQGLYAEWGFSAFIRTPSGNLLWDTGGILHVLLHNLRALAFDLRGLRILRFPTATSIMRLASRTSSRGSVGKALGVSRDRAPQMG